MIKPVHTCACIWRIKLRRLKLHGRKRQKVSEIQGLKNKPKNNLLACQRSSRFCNTKRPLMSGILAPFWS